MAAFFYLIGGIGLFLLGMTLLSDGLKSFAGNALRNALVRFTGKPLKAFASGAMVTAMVQSSSATTVAVIGFVSAGLLTFPQAVGVVMGASLGTTATGWIVSVLGLKVNLGYYALPLVGAGALMKLLAAGRWRAMGSAWAGFGLIFVGISYLQQGMEGLSGVFDLAALPQAGFLAHWLTMGIGLTMTVVMQSSSAAVATTLTALHAGSVNFDQAASLVIGAAVGTTVTGAIAAIGASVSTKRTALAHILFNVTTGFIAVLLLPLFTKAIGFGQERLGLAPGAMSLAAFHTLFIGLGAVLFLPFTEKISRQIERLLPEKGPLLTRHLDDALLSVPAVALEAARRSLCETAAEMIRIIRLTLEGQVRVKSGLSETELRGSLDQIGAFFARIPTAAEIGPFSGVRVWQMHAIEHLDRLSDYLRPPGMLGRIGKADSELYDPLETLRRILKLAEAGLEISATTERSPQAAFWTAQLQDLSLAITEIHHRARPVVLKKTAMEGAPMLALQTLDAIRWMDRVGYHVWRISNYLAGDGASEPSLSSGVRPSER